MAKKEVKKLRCWTIQQRPGDEGFPVGNTGKIYREISNLEVNSPRVIPEGFYLFGTNGLENRNPIGTADLLIAERLSTTIFILTTKTGDKYVVSLEGYKPSI